MGFQVTYKGTNIWKCRTTRSGVQLGSPLLDWAGAAQWWGLDWDKFLALPSDAQSFRVAVYRTNRQIDAVLAYAHQRKMKQAVKARKHPRRK